MGKNNKFRDSLDNIRITYTRYKDPEKGKIGEGKLLLRYLDMTDRISRLVERLGKMDFKWEFEHEDFDLNAMTYEDIIKFRIRSGCLKSSF